MEHLIPILGIIFVMGPVATLAFSFTPLGRALVERLRGRAREGDEQVFDLRDEIERLQEHNGQQDQRIEEIYDRLDFTERMLVKKTSRPDEVPEVVTPV